MCSAILSMPLRAPEQKIDTMLSVALEEYKVSYKQVILIDTRTHHTTCLFYCNSCKLGEKIIRLACLVGQESQQVIGTRQVTR